MIILNLFYKYSITHKIITQKWLDKVSKKNIILMLKEHYMKTSKVVVKDDKVASVSVPVYFFSFKEDPRTNTIR
ncbi:MAG: hypothetical protein LBL16_04160 [Endomicrobium sp.]|nr:hypothetical protein [Endomicrobium sp.]